MIETTLDIHTYAERAYLEYALSVVKGRALPDGADGQKPVQRRILFAMREMGLHSTGRHVKSARVVGEILGKYHPHGDASAYEAMVRLAQDFTLRYPLVDGQGNFGSRDGDGAAAMRYTEARLTAFAEHLLLSELEEGTVDFRPNYDGAFQEPVILPARLPMVLLNGASGIAVGMATEIPSHHLGEVANATVALIRNPALSQEAFYALLPGPDFAGGGHLISSPQDIHSAYETGKGSLRVRAVWETERLARGQWRIIVTQLPPNTSTQKILTEIEEATNPKIKAGKKALTQEQLNTRQWMLSLIERARDESDQTQPVRLVLEPKSSKIDPEAFMNALRVQTSLETTVSLNLVMIGQDGRPQQKSCRAILEEWIAFRKGIVLKRTAYRLETALARIHLLEGRLLAFADIEAVIDVIRNSDTPQQDLMLRFGLSAIQTQDILDIRLRQLARLEGIQLEKERNRLLKDVDILRQIVGSQQVLERLLIQEIEADTKQFSDARRTKIEAAERATVTQSLPDEPITVILSEKGWIRMRNGHGLETSLLTFKEGDQALSVVETRTVYPILLFDTLGRIYTLSAEALPGGRGEGVPLVSLIDLQDGAKVAYMCSGNPSHALLLSQNTGYGFIAKVSDLLSRQKAGKAVIALQEGASLCPPVWIENQTTLILKTDLKRTLECSVENIKQLPKGKGNLLGKFKKGERVAQYFLKN